MTVSALTLDEVASLDLTPSQLSAQIPPGLKVGLIGAGRIVQGEVMPAYVAAGITPIAVVDPDPTALELMKRKWGIRSGYTDYREMLSSEELDVLDVNIRWDVGLSPLRVEIVRAAAERGIHVIIAKALAEHWEQCEQIVDAAREGGVMLAVDHNTRYSPSFYGAGALLRAGALGSPIAGSINYHSALGRQHTNEFNAAHDVCVHGVDVLLSWFDREPETVYAKWSRRVDTIGSVLSATFSFTDGVVGTLLYDFATRHRRQFEFILVGDSASADGLQDQELPPASRMLRSTLRYGPHSNPGMALELPLRYTQSPQSYLATRMDLFRSIGLGQEPGVSGASVLRTMKTLFALLESIKSGSPTEMADYIPRNL